MSHSTNDIPQRRRGVGPLSCRECRRLKLKCNRQFPCTSCERRGCASVCPNGIVEAGRGSRRHILATTSQLQETVRCLETRISELEEALAQSHAMHSSTPHPLLQERSPTLTQTNTAPSAFLPAPGQSSPPPATIASTSPPAYSPHHTTYNIDNTGSNASRVHQQPYSDVSGGAVDDLIKCSRLWVDIPQNYDPLDLQPHSSISSAGDVSSSSSVEFPPTFVSNSYTSTSAMRSGILSQGQQQVRVPEAPEPDLMYIYQPYYSNQWA